MQNTKTFKKILGGGAAAATLAGAVVMSQAPAASASGDWDRLAECESNGDWSINTGNGYYGGLQFSLQSWQAVGGSGYPHEASKQEQIHRAEQLHQIQGWGAWPSCSAQLGLSGNPGTGTPSDGGGQDEQPQEEAQQEEPAEQPQEEAPQEEAPQEQPQEEAPQEEAPQEQPQEETQQEEPAEEEVAQPWMASAEPNTGVEVSDETHTIEEGQSLSSIADELGIEDWQDLWGANADEIDDPNVIFVGQEIKLPVF